MHIKNDVFVPLIVLSVLILASYGEDNKADDGLTADIGQNESSPPEPRYGIGFTLGY